MGLKNYRNKITGEVKPSLKKLNDSEWIPLLEAPHAKFLENKDPLTGKSKLKDQEKILKARARNHSRERDIDENITFNRDNGLDDSVRRNLLNAKGERRRKLDDV
jgi:hypothetical protein